MNHTEHMVVLRQLRSKLTGEEKASLRYILNKVENLESRLKNINRISHIRRDAPVEDWQEV